MKDGLQGRVWQWWWRELGFGCIDRLNNIIEGKGRRVLFPASSQVIETLALRELAGGFVLTQPLELRVREGVQRTDGQSSGMRLAARAEKPGPKLPCRIAGEGYCA